MAGVGRAGVGAGPFGVIADGGVIDEHGHQGRGGDGEAGRAEQGATLAAASNDGTVHLRDTSSAVARADVRAGVGQPLTRLEWATYVPGLATARPADQRVGMERLLRGRAALSAGARAWVGCHGRLRRGGYLRTRTGSSTSTAG